MSDIPEDVMKRAREVAEAVCLQGMSPTDCHIDAIARALMEERAAERERCAKIATDKALGHMEATRRTGTDYNYHVGAWKVCKEVADEILGASHEA